jgi:tetratricopeptide (TPR) repeat protein
MKYSAALFLLILFSLPAFAQKTNSTKKPVTPAKTSVVNPAGETEEFEKAAALANPAEKIAALQKFIKNFPKSARKNRALELIVSARGQIGDERLRANEAASGIEFFKLAVKDAPTPVSDELFTNILLQFPTNVFAGGQYVAAAEIAKLIEEKVGENPKQLLGLATFYLGTENGAEAKRLAEKAISAESALTEKPNLSAAFQTLGLASRMNFEFEESAAAYAKALEADSASIVSRRGLAEMKRALGKSDEAAALYQEILAKDATDASAQTGAILSLFDAGKQKEAEAEMAKSLEAAPNNLFLLVGAAYWYAAHNDGAKAVELAQKAVALEPRYSWAYIALARGFMAQKQPLEAEKTLLTARLYGDFPTLDYELAAARMQAGFYREAAEILKRNFSVKNDYVKAWIGNRVALEAKSFLELLAVERRASIFQPLAADSPDTAEKLKALLELAQKLEAADAGDTEISELADRFVSGDDSMKLHRQIFVAKQLLQQKKAIAKVLELAQAATGKVDAALDVANPSAAVLAEELYDSRRYAMSRREIIVIPNIERQTLSKILRGEIEEITGWALFQQNKSAEATIRLKRALSILPEKSAWWRSSLWKLGASLDAEGKQAEALENYIKSYTNGEPDAAKYMVIEALYQKVNGNIEGLEQKIGAKPALFNSQTQTVVQPTPTATPLTETKTETSAIPSPTPTTEETPQIVAETKPSPSPVSTPQTETKAEETEVKETPNPTPQTSPTIETKTENTNETTTKSADDKKSETENKQAENSKTQKSLFEPIIITIPKTEPVKKPQTENKQAEEKPAENSKTEESKSEETVAQNSNSGETRVRKVNGNKSEETLPCTIVASQESVTIVNGGGSLGILVGFEKEGDLKEIKATSSSPQDVEAVYDPEIGGNSGRAFFLIKSISANKGAFTLTFDAPCGKKEILVKVR